MAIRNILLEGNELLYKKCRPVEKFDEKLGLLIDDMFETMEKPRASALQLLKLEF